MNFHRHIRDAHCSGKRFEIEIDFDKVAHGYLFILKTDNHQRKPFAVIEDLFVNPHDRGKGYGQQLVEWMIDEAKKEGCYKIVLTSRDGRPKLHAWYERLGFSSHGRSFRMNL